MIQIKSAEQIEKMRAAGRITAQALKLAGENVKVGISTAEIDTIVREYIQKNGATPSFLGYGGFPASCCISINSEVIHGIPSPSRVIACGDVVKIDIGAYLDGYHGDCADTFIAGIASEEKLKLVETVRAAFWTGVEQLKLGNRMGDVSAAIQATVESAEFDVVKKFIGHGIGANLHEEPEVPNYGTVGRGTRLAVGMTLAIEPMIAAGSADVRVLEDDWTVVTVDGSLAAHFEHTVVLTENGVEILTLAD